MTDDNTKQVGTELPTPPNFPVDWIDDEENTYLWRWDDIHSPLPVTPMSLSVNEYTSAPRPAEGDEPAKPPTRSTRKRIHGYSYSTSLPDESTPEQKEAKQAETAEQIASVHKRWDEEFLPTIQKHFKYMRSKDLNAASDDELLVLLDEFLEMHRQHWKIHGMVVTPMHVSADQMADMYREIMDDVPDEEPYILLQGLDNKSLETDRALQALTDVARSSAEVSEIFATEHTAVGINQGLSSSEEGQEFIKHLNAFLDVYGYRPTGFDISFPTWKEDQTFIFLNVKNYLAQPPRDLDKEKTELIAESEKYLAEILKKLEGDARLDAFDKAYQASRELWHLKEDHAFFIDQGSNAMMRIIIAHIGRRLAEIGYLDNPEDVFYITLDELRAGLEGNASEDIKANAKERRAYRDQYSAVIPPKFLGTMPPEGSDTFASAFRRMSGPITLLESDLDAGILRGVPGSAGVTTGTARVIRAPEEFGKIRPGDVLVCTSTSPTWTPLFGSVSALVSDSGGVLSHTAIVAREYKLPAVVGVNSGTATISDGQLITVDGDRGVVTIH